MQPFEPITSSNYRWYGDDDIQKSPVQSVLSALVAKPFTDFLHFRFLKFHIIILYGTTVGSHCTPPSKAQLSPSCIYTHTSLGHFSLSAHEILVQLYLYIPHFLVWHLMFVQVHSIDIIMCVPKIIYGFNA